jgi:cytochrome P450
MTGTLPTEPYPSLAYAENPYNYYDALRARGGVYRVPETGDFLVASWKDINYITRHPEIFSSRLANRIASKTEHPDRNAADPTDSSVVFSDAPDHDLKRRIISPALMPRKVVEYEDGIRRICDDVIDGFPDDGDMEFVSEFAKPFPIRVMMHVLDLPQEDLPKLLEWSQNHTSFAEKYLPAGAPRKSPSNGAIWDYIEAILRDRLLNPRDDAYTQFLRDHQATFGQIRWPQAIGDATLLLTGGLVTTGEMLASAMMLLMHDSAQMAAVRNDLATIPNMVEEALRLESPVQWQPRVAAVDCELNGVEIPAGSVVLMVLGAGNRDPEHFNSPDTFDIRRANAREHFSVSRGTHACAGASLARLEARIAFERLIERLSDISLSARRDGVTRINSLHHRAPRELWLRVRRQQQ